LELYEKRAFWKFFLIYFSSVSLLILASGFFYFEDQKSHMIETENFTLIDYARNLKMHKGNYSDPQISHTVIHKKIPYFSMNNLNITEEYFEKLVPHTWEKDYLQIRKSTSSYHAKRNILRIQILSMQLLLIALFALLSYFLARNALSPMQEAISKLDHFAKDLIHDLNTPVTSILLNIKLLNKSAPQPNTKALKRVEKSAQEISELHQNLTILLQEDTFQLQRQNLCIIVNEIVSHHQVLFPHLDFRVECHHFNASVNAKAMTQVLNNLISNACKYNKAEGYVKIYTSNKTLIIEDGGIGIQEPEKVFDRTYSEHRYSSGLGLDIVKRLCDTMQIELSVKSTAQVGSHFFLTFK